jgi:hypothetical protein
MSEERHPTAVEDQTSQDAPAPAPDAPAEVPAEEAPGSLQQPVVEDAPPVEQPEHHGEPEHAEAAQPEQHGEPEHHEAAQPEQHGEPEEHHGDEEERPAVGPRILGVAEEPKPLPIVKQKLREKPAPPKREPLPFPELRAVVALVREAKGEDKEQLKELFRLLPPKVRDEVVEGVREFRKGARRPLSQHAAKNLARAVHTARRQKRSAAPNPEVGDALSQAIIGELVASLDVELAAEVILPKRDLLDRQARQARRRQREEEDRERDEFRRRRREDAKANRGQSSFGTFSGTKIKGLDELAAAFGLQGDPEPETPAADPEPETPTAADREPEAPAAEVPTEVAEVAVDDEPAAAQDAPEDAPVPAQDAPAPEAADEPDTPA